MQKEKQGAASLHACMGLGSYACIVHAIVHGTNMIDQPINVPSSLAREYHAGPLATWAGRPYAHVTCYDRSSRSDRPGRATASAVHTASLGNLHRTLC
jgi:hypothetical protein